MRSFSSAAVVLIAIAIALALAPPVNADILVSDYGNHTVLKFTDAGVQMPPVPYLTNGGGGTEAGPDGGFITGSDFLMDGGVTASYRYGELAPE